MTSGQLTLASLLLGLVACVGSPDGGGSADAGGAKEPLPVPMNLDAQGYADFGGGIYPPLRYRVSALPCLPAEGGCITDGECAPGESCVCSVLGFGECLPAECVTNEDCPTGYCLVSAGRGPTSCDDNIPAGLFCSRTDSTCSSGADCPGNGNECVFLRDSQRFECAVTSGDGCE